LIRFKAAQSVCIETFKDFPQLGRFMLRDEGKTIAVGIITALHFPKAGGAPSGDGMPSGSSASAAGGGDD
jgi:sulfate adenylyltransferase subunit 1 (EFTu-like GTPase family)